MGEDSEVICACCSCRGGGVDGGLGSELGGGGDLL